MHKVSVYRNHGEHNVRTEVIVDQHGAPEIVMSLDDFRNAMIEELDSMTWVFTKKATEVKVSEAFNKVVNRMKQDSAKLAQFIS